MIWSFGPLVWTFVGQITYETVLSLFFMNLHPRRALRLHENLFGKKKSFVIKRVNDDEKYNDYWWRIDREKMTIKFHLEQWEQILGKLIYKNALYLCKHTNGHWNIKGWVKIMFLINAISWLLQFQKIFAQSLKYTITK